MLIIIQDEQQIFLAQVVDDLDAGGIRAIKGDAQRRSGSGWQQTGRTNRSQADEKYAIFKMGKQLASGLKREARFANSARPNQGQKSAGRLGQQSGNLG